MLSPARQHAVRIVSSFTEYALFSSEEPEGNGGARWRTTTVRNGCRGIETTQFRSE